jgi:photosystem II stability/assembly factor-like uncharacterized protein
VVSPSAQGAGSTPSTDADRGSFQAVALAFWNVEDGVATGEMTCRGCPRRRVGVVLATHDGGTTWHVVFRGGKSAGDVTTLGPDEALARLGRRLVRATDGGSAWDPIGQSEVRALSFIDDLTGWAVRGSLPGRLVTTTDGGRTWRPQADPCGPVSHFWGPGGWQRPSVNYVRDVWFATPTHGWVLCGGDGAAGSAPVAVFETTDGGGTWTKREAVWDAQPGGLQFLPDGRGWRWSFDFGEVSRTPDGGSTWHRGGTFENGGPENSIWFVDADTGFALGQGNLWRSDDGGRSWSVVAPIEPT